MTAALTTSNGSGSGGGVGDPGVLAGADGVAGALASTGADLERDAVIGAALVAGGWVMHRWASRSPRVATEAGEAAGTEPAPDAP